MSSATQTNRTLVEWSGLTMKHASLISLLALLLLCQVTDVASQKRGRAARQSGRTTVISCRVFRRGVCKKTKSNIILVNKSISSK